MINIVVLLGGKGQRFKGYCDKPKPLIPVLNSPMYRLSTNFFCKENFVEEDYLLRFVLNADANELRDDIENHYPNAKITLLDKPTSGPIETLTKGLADIDNGERVVSVDCDLMVRIADLNVFLESKLQSVGVVTFQSSSPNFSYIVTNSNEMKVAEKEVISNNAVAGAYFLPPAKETQKNISDFLNENTESDEIYISHFLNYLIQKGLDIEVLKSDIHVSYGTPSEIDENMYLISKYGELYDD